MAVKSANLLKHKAMWFYSTPFCIAQHLAKSSRVLISGSQFFIIHFIGALVRGISLSQRHFAALAFISRYWNTSFEAVSQTICKAASWWFDCWYACWSSIIAQSGSTEIAFTRLQSWQIWSENWFRRCIFTKLKSNSSARCCSISHSICIVSPWTRQPIAAPKILFQASPVSHPSGLCTLCCISKASEIFFVDLLLWNRLNTYFSQWNPSRHFSMYSIVASVWYWYCAIRWKYIKFLPHNRASVKGICGLTEEFERVLWILKRSCAQVLSSPYHFIVSHGYMARWIEQSQDEEASSPKAGWICESWNAVWGRMLPSPSNAYSYRERWYEEYQVR